MNPNDIIELVEKEFNLPLGILKSSCKLRNVNRARAIAIWLSFKLIDCTEDELGRFFRRNKSTIKYLLQKVNTDDIILNKLWEKLQNE